MSTNINGEKIFEISGGPNRDMLVDAFKYTYDHAAHVKVTFQVPFTYGVPLHETPFGEKPQYYPMRLSDVRITSLEHEDGSGHSFNIHGYCRADLNPFRADNPVLSSYRFKAYYHAQSRKGWITFSLSR